MARTKTPDRTSGPTRFTRENMESVAKDLKSGRLPLSRTQMSDDMVTGLRAQIYKSGLIGFHVCYTVGEKRPFINIGSLNEDQPDHITISEARNLAKTIKALGDKGIDVQDGLHKRLFRELAEKGTAWRPK